MKALRSLAIAAAVVAGAAGLSSAASAQVHGDIGLDIGPAPMCPYGYYAYVPYPCAPYGYYGPD